MGDFFLTKRRFRHVLFVSIVYNDDFEEGSMAVSSLICKWEAASAVVYYVAASSYCVDAIKQHHIHKLHSHCLGYKTCTKLIEKKTRADSQEDFLWSSLDLRQQKQTRLTYRKKSFSCPRQHSPALCEMKYYRGEGTHKWRYLDK